MKKILFFLMPVVVLALIVSCSKSSDTPVVTSRTSLEGTWAGSYSNGTGGPVNFFSMTFKSGGGLVVHANNATTPDVANGSWTLVADSVKGSYTYVGSSGISSFAAKYSSSSNVMAGTVGVGSSTAGESVFLVTKQ